MKQKAKVYKGKRIVIGDKNLVTKNEIHVNDIPQEGGESGGGNNGGVSKRNIKYYDCLLGDLQGGHGEFYNAKYLNDEGGVTIAAWGDVPGLCEGGRIAIAIDEDMALYWEGQWRTVQDIYNHYEFDPTLHPEITEEEFYHIPEAWVCDGGSEEDAKKLFEYLYPIIERYKSIAQPDEWREGFSELQLPLAPWIKSLEKFRPDLGYTKTVSTVYGFWEREKYAPWLRIYDTTNGLVDILPYEEADNLPFFGIAFLGPDQWGVGRYTLPDGSTRYGYWQIAG